MQQFKKHTRIIFFLTLSFLSLAVSYAPVPFLNLHCKKVQKTHKEQNFFNQHSPAEQQQEGQPINQAFCSPPVIYFTPPVQISHSITFSVDKRTFLPFVELLRPQDHSEIPDNPPQG